MHLRTRRVAILAALILVAIIVAAAWLFAGVLLTHYDFDLFVNDLRAAGATVELPSEPERDFGWFPVPPRTIVVNGNFIHIYQFTSNRQAFWASCHVMSNGQTIAPMEGTLGVSIDWATVGPRWYRKGQIITIYGGSDPSTNTIIEQMLGSPFTGGPSRGAPGGIPL